MPKAGVEFSYKFSDDNTKIAIVVAIDVNNLDKEYVFEEQSVEALIYGHNGAKNINELIESVENAGTTGEIQ